MYCTLKHNFKETFVCFEDLSPHDTGVRANDGVTLESLLAYHSCRVTVIDGRIVKIGKRDSRYSCV